MVSGTSFATPFVTGASALLMEWGIVRGNDPFLYGEKVKAYLRRGARELPESIRTVRWGMDDSVWREACQIKMLYL